jgi:acyl dehydratase
MEENLLYFDDLRVGDKFSSGTHEVHADDIKRFATEFDPQPFHLDNDAARDSLFAGLAASGWHTAAITMRLLVTGGPKLANGIIGAGGDIEWKAPTRPGDVLHVESEVVELIPSRSRPDRGTLMLRSRTLTQRGEVVQSLTAKLVLARRTVENIPQT